VAAIGRLYVVATPLGNLEDLSQRALRTLKEASLIACEDTRRTGELLRHFGIATPTTSYFEHNEKWKGRLILDALRAGKDVALVSDAGTPGVSDPGYRLVRDAQDAGATVIPVPGASAAVAALSVSGLPSDRFLFVGFLPSRTSARRAALSGLGSVRDTLIFYESPVRAVAALADIVEAFGDREGFLCREATKLHEEYRRGPLSELRKLLAERERVRGEIVLVVAGAPDAAKAVADDASLQALFASLTSEGQTRRAAVKEIARRTGLPAREVYRRTMRPGESSETEG
jgi:16S rRNA (cytidine1402-2'-O)-methyltransferase